ncbi:hypothetical protein IWZ03DRAFT_410103 [Phyllosticta citriasiana]|uniref:Uncharacterized protein n=1 Tax=Phyllosticta citriasiana TaxID=595635 RepID=A0ABR1K859_9PEZI
MDKKLKRGSFRSVADKIATMERSIKKKWDTEASSRTVGIHWRHPVRRGRCRATNVSHSCSRTDAPSTFGEYIPEPDGSVVTGPLEIVAQLANTGVRGSTVIAVVRNAILDRLTQIQHRETLVASGKVYIQGLPRRSMEEGHIRSDGSKSKTGQFLTPFGCGNDLEEIARLDERMDGKRPSGYFLVLGLLQQLVVLKPILITSFLVYLYFTIYIRAKNPIYTYYRTISKDTKGKYYLGTLIVEIITKLRN